MIYNEAGYLMLGSRLKRLGDRLLNEVKSVYRALDIPFETSWFPVFYVLKKRGMCSISELSEHLAVSHSAVSQLIGHLERRNLIGIRVSEADQRRKEIVLMPDGLKLMDQVLPVWHALERTFSSSLTPRLIEVLDSLEQELNTGDLAADVIESMGKGESLSVEEQPEISAVIQHFISAHDLHVQESSSFIVAKDKEAVIGLIACTCGGEAIRVSDFFVAPSYRRMGIGIRMLRMLLNKHKQKELIIQRTTAAMLQLLHVADISFSVVK